MNTKAALLVVVMVLHRGSMAMAEPTVTPPAGAAPPPAGTVQRSEADLEKLVAPIALYPDPLLATLLPASAYPLEIVQAARFIKDTNNIPKVDSQTWDQNVKALARFPDVMAKMNEDVGWTSDLGQAFVDQQKDVMNAVQVMRGKAQQAGNLKTTPQQVVVVTNTVVEKTVEQKIVVVTNTIVQIEPAQPQVIYVPTYDPVVVYAPSPPGEVFAASVISFGVGMAVGAIIANNCNWHSGGVYVGPHGAVAWSGGYHGDVNVNVNRSVNVNQNFNRSANVNQNVNRSANLSGQTRWQPDQSRRTTSSPTSTAQSRGWGSSNLGATQRPTPTASPASRAPSGGSLSGGSSGHSAFGGFGGGAQTRMASDRGASSFGGLHGGGFHGRR